VADPTRGLDALLRAAASSFPLLSSCTPVNAASEHARLVAAWSRGEEQAPRWKAPSIDRGKLATLRREIERASKVLEALAGDPWFEAYGAKLDEVSRELAVVDAAFGPGLAAAAEARYPTSAALTKAADERAERLRASRQEAKEEPVIATDDPQAAGSLLSRMRAELSRRGVAVRVMVRPRVGALAATGDGVVIVAEGRAISAAETERVVLHEIEGHVMPRERGRSGPVGLCWLGGAGSSEEEEGRALLLEARAGFLVGARARSLAARHRAASMARGGASFVEMGRALVRELDGAIEPALAICARVLRGANLEDGEVRGGLCRERTYLPAWLTIERAVATEPGLMDDLGRARLPLALHRALARGGANSEALRFDLRRDVR
jgi:hypothetical protein